MATGFDGFIARGDTTYHFLNGSLSSSSRENESVRFTGAANCRGVLVSAQIWGEQCVCVLTPPPANPMAGS